jgi:tRNA threonylcarbamoyladenosine biosynthesis protein TsaB
MELILDASSRSTRVGVALKGLLQWTSDPLAPQEHTRQLLPAILKGMESTSTAFHELELIVVALGPGPFNGLRVAVSAAKGLGAGTGAAVVGISTLEAEAHRCSPGTGTVRPVIAAGRTAVATALFEWRDSAWVQVEDTRLVEAAELTQFLDESAPLCGEIDDAFDVVHAAAREQALRIATGRGSRLDSLAELGWKRFCTGDVASVAALQPLYARPPHITIPRDRRP